MTHQRRPPCVEVRASDETHGWKEWHVPGLSEPAAERGRPTPETGNATTHTARPRRQVGQAHFNGDRPVHAGLPVLSCEGDLVCDSMLHFLTWISKGRAERTFFSP